MSFWLKKQKQTQQTTKKNKLFGFLKINCQSML